MDNEQKNFEIEEIKKKLEECQKQKDEYLAGWQRARADLLNYKKEEIERVLGLLKYGTEEFILKLLPILDSFERAEKTFLKEGLNGQNKEIIQGFSQIKKQLDDFLKSQGIREIEVKNGENFNPNFEEIIEEVKVDKEEEVNKIIEITERGYKFYDKVIKPAKVKIGVKS